jgi:hypothetical protein
MFGKAWKYKKDERDHREITKSLESVSEALQKMNTKLDNMQYIRRINISPRRTKRL